MAHLQINSDIGCGGIFVLRQLFIFGSFVLRAGLTGHLGVARHQIIRFGSSEYTADSHSNLTLFGWVPERLENATDVVALTMD